MVLDLHGISHGPKYTAPSTPPHISRLNHKPDLQTSHIPDRRPPEDVRHGPQAHHRGIGQSPSDMCHDRQVQNLDARCQNHLSQLRKPFCFSTSTFAICQAYSLTDVKIDLPNTRDKVPLGSSSASMYPGYSPADHVYGQAAMQYGNAVAKAKAEGIDLRPHADLEYELGQAKGIKRQKLADMQGLQYSSESASGSGADAPFATNGKKLGSEKSDAKDEEMGDAAQPSFYIDTEPTPVKLPLSEKNDSKRVTSGPEPVEENKSKKSKKTHDGELPAAPAQGKIETEDISAEVDARMKEKEEKRQRKEEAKRKKEAAKPSGTGAAAEEVDTRIVATDDKKRKRESAGSSAAAVTVADPPVNGEEVKKPKKKKSKKEKDGESSVNKVSEDAAPAARNESSSKNSEPAPTEPQKSSETNANKKKKEKKSKKEKEDIESTPNKPSENPAPAQTESKKRSKHEAEGKQKKRKKRKLEEGAAESS